MRDKWDSYERIVKNLIVQVRKDDQEAFAELLEIYDPLITSFVNRFCKGEVTMQDGEDLKQELTVVFYNAILSYDMNQEDVNFGLYAKICLNNAFITQCRAYQKRRNRETVSLEEEGWILDEQSDDEDPSRDVIMREEMKELNRKIDEALSPLEGKVWRLYVSGCTLREIATDLGKNEKSIENAIFRVKQKLKQLLS